MASPTVTRFTDPQQIVVPLVRHSANIPGEITQLEIAALLSLRNRARQIEQQITDAEQSFRVRLEAGALVEAGEHTAELRKASGAMSPGRKSWLASLSDCTARTVAKLTPGMCFRTPGQLERCRLLFSKRNGRSPRPSAHEKSSPAPVGADEFGARSNGGMAMRKLISTIRRTLPAKCVT